MKYKWTIILSFVAAALIFGLPALNEIRHAQQRQNKAPEAADWQADQQEIHKFYQLAPAAQVELSGINGPVEIETAEAETAEVHITRLTQGDADPNSRKITIEHTPTSLVIRGERSGGRSFSFWGHRSELRHHVVLKLPRQIELTTKSINGNVKVGEVDGPVKLNGINGRTEVAQAKGYSEISGLNGGVVITVTQLGERGINVRGVNGRVELHFAEDLNADLSVRGVNGKVDTGMPMTVEGQFNPRNFHARLGSGGAPIILSGINGNVRLERATPAGESAQKPGNAER